MNFEIKEEKTFKDFLKEIASFEFGMDKNKNIPTVSPIDPNLNPNSKFFDFGPWITQNKDKIDALLIGLKNSKKIPNFDEAIMGKDFKEKAIYIAGVIKQYFPDMDATQLDLVIRDSGHATANPERK